MALAVRAAFGRSPVRGLFRTEDRLEIIEHFVEYLLALTPDR
jgi:hypothetical protein